MDKNKELREILKRLKKAYPGPKTALHFGDPFELLVATILSAQTTDVHVNRVTESLFKKYKSVRDYADAPIDTLRKDISSINFYNNKAKNIQASARIIVEKYRSKVPRTMEESNAFGINEGIAVDTHVKRLSGRLGLTKYEDPVKIEKDLMEITPREDWSNLSHLLIFHGRQVCQAKKPKHQDCVLFDICPSRDI
jgi:endonuclease-3